MNRRPVHPLRTLLVLGRVSNLPTVWSNCLAGWWLSGGGTYAKLPLLLLGATMLYLGGMFLNDAFDADFDGQRRADRPIPSGLISVQSVWIWGWSWLAAGLLCLAALGQVTGTIAVLLAVCIVVYDATHKAITASPWLMGLCRFWVYVIGGSTGAYGLTGWPIWCGAALMLYVAGLSCLARNESFRKPVPRWPLALLVAPVSMALLMNVGDYRLSAIWLSLVLVLWLAYCARSIFLPEAVHVGRIVSGLLAGIIFVDWLAVGPDCPRALSFTLLVLFGATRLLQRFVPAT
jgi:4-hydroxybenzoate polyprenyltransferase